MMIGKQKYLLKSFSNLINYIPIQYLVWRLIRNQYCCIHCLGAQVTVMSASPDVITHCVCYFWKGLVDEIFHMLKTYDRCLEYSVKFTFSNKKVPNVWWPWRPAGRTISAGPVLFDANRLFSEIICLQEFSHCRATKCRILTSIPNYKMSQL